MKRIIAVLLSIAVFGIAAPSSADQVLYETDFENPPFSVGDLVGQDGWANHSGSGSLIQVIANGGGQAVQLAHGGGSREDANIDLGTVMTANHTYFFNFDVTVNGTDDASTVYFAHFKDSLFGFNARVFVTTPNVASNNFTFGIGETSSSAVAATFGTDFTYGTTYNLSGGYSFDTGISTLSVNGGTAIDSTSQADPSQALSAFAFRQAGGNTSMIIDNVRISSIPEPGSCGIMIAFATGMLIRRRR